MEMKTMETKNKLYLIESGDSNLWKWDSSDLFPFRSS
jgi:hypothetical protein